MNNEVEERPLSTADLASAAEANASRAANQAQDMRQHQAAAADSRQAAGTGPADARTASAEQLEPLFQPEAARSFKAKWEAVQVGFVDDPRAAVRHGDELVAQVMKSLADTFSSERAKLEAQFEQTSDQASTENLRLAFRRYRSFFERLLAL